MSVLVLLICTILALSDSANIEDFSSGNKLFAADVYNEIVSNSGGNFLVSPFSVEAVLALAQSGAKAQTAEEIRTSLHLPDSKEETENVIKNALSLFQNNDYILRTANKIYIEDYYPVNEEFKKDAAEIYQAEAENIEFLRNVEAAKKINDWVAEQTNDKIQDLVKSDDLGKETKLVLLNALYFQGNWSTPFEAFRTTKKTFYKSLEDEVETDMMMIFSVSANYKYNEDLDAQILELPFEGGASMTFILPNEKDGISLLEKAVNRVVDSQKYSVEIVQVLLPKFKIETSTDFKTILKNLGINAAFDYTQADFTGIGGQKGDLFIGKVVQKTFIDVNEEGVEAAAATGGIIIPPPSLPPTPTKFFVADHPFIFYLKVNNIILFEGRVMAP